MSFKDVFGDIADFAAEVYDEAKTNPVKVRVTISMIMSAVKFARDQWHDMASDRDLTEAEEQALYQANDDFLVGQKAIMKQKLKEADGG